MNRSGKLGVAVVFLFGLPFAAFGLIAISQAMRLAGSGAVGPPFWPPLIFGVVFSSIGFGLMFVALIGGRSSARQQRLEAEHPTEPWLWRADWAQGRANSKTRTTTIGSWILAVFWNLISMPIAWLVVPAAVKQKGPIAYLVLVFPAVGVLLLVYAIRQTIALFEFGQTYFEMASVPGVIGRELKGTIQARFPHSPDHGVHLRLSCVHMVTTGSGNSRSTNQTILWRDEVDLSSGQLCPDQMGTTVPVSFRIPLDAHPTEKASPGDACVWLLEARASVPGVNYHDVFEVPVFRTAATPTSPETEEQASPFAAAVATAARPERMTVRVQPNTDGTEFYFPPARNPGFSASTTVFAAIFGGITYFLMHVHAPLIFRMALGFFSLVLIYVAAQMWLGTSRVVIGSSLKVQAGMLGGGRVREIALADIASIDDKIMSQQGGGTGTPYYDIVLKLRSGRWVTLGRTLPNKQETEWLVSEMRRLAGLQTKAAGAGSSS